MNVRDLLKLLSTSPGVSGFEHHVAALIEEAWSGLADAVWRDRLGNVVAVKRATEQGPGRRPRLMLAAHMDEIGLLVTRVEKEGFLRFGAVDQVDPRVLLGKEVTVHGRRDLAGVIGLRPPHMLGPEERRKLPKLEDLFIDIGYGGDTARELVAVGDPVTLKAELWELKGGLLAGKAFDDRVGVAVLHGCLGELARLRHGADVCVVATVQEEVGMRGARVGTWALEPDLAVAVDVCLGDGPGIPEDAGWPLGKGPVITVGANVHPVLQHELASLAQELNLPYQVEAAPAATGTDAWVMQVTGAGIPTALVSIPCRYMHSAVETVALADVAAASRLLAHFAARCDAAYLEGLRWE